MKKLVRCFVGPVGWPPKDDVTSPALQPCFRGVAPPRSSIIAVSFPRGCFCLPDIGSSLGTPKLPDPAPPAYIGGQVRFIRRVRRIYKYTRTSCPREESFLRLLGVSRGFLLAMGGLSSSEMVYTHYKPPSASRARLPVSARK